MTARLSQAERVKARYHADPEAARAYMREWKRQHPRDRAVERQRMKARRGLHDAHVAAWRARPKNKAVPAVLHDAHVRRFKEDAVHYRWRYANDPDFSLHERMRRQVRKKLHFDPHLAEIIRAAMRRGGESDRVTALLGYTIAQLRAHLERQFRPGMTWQGLSRTGWHVDHILPRKCFDVGTLEGIRAYWSLSNLRPLWAADNLRKGARIEALT